jgi:hypothetical protein
VTVTFTLHGETHSISRDDVLRVARTAVPDPIAAAGYYVEIDGRQFPPTQLVHLAARTLTRPHSHNSRSILARLGFTAHPARESPPPNRQTRQTTEGVTSAVLGDWRHKRLRILDSLDGRPASTFDAELQDSRAGLRPRVIPGVRQLQGTGADGEADLHHNLLQGDTRPLAQPVGEPAVSARFWVLS